MRLIQVAGILLGDSKQLGSALNSDVVVEPVRGPLIPGFRAVKDAALAAGDKLLRANWTFRTAQH